MLNKKMIEKINSAVVTGAENNKKILQKIDDINNELKEAVSVDTIIKDVDYIASELLRFKHQDPDDDFILGETRCKTGIRLALTTGSYYPAVFDEGNEILVKSYRQKLYRRRHILETSKIKNSVKLRFTKEIYAEIVGDDFKIFCDELIKTYNNRKSLGERITFVNDVFVLRTFTEPLEYYDIKDYSSERAFIHNSDNFREYLIRYQYMNEYPSLNTKDSQGHVYSKPANKAHIINFDDKFTKKLLKELGTIHLQIKKITTYDKKTQQIIKLLLYDKYGKYLVARRI